MRFIPVAKPNISIAEASAVFQVIKNGWISMGKKVNQFEKNISKFTNVKYVVAMNNGTSTLDALLTALDISKDDEVIVPNLTYISTANVVSYKKAKLVLCDSDRDTFNTTKEKIEKRITKKTKLIIVTDMKGMPVDYDAIKLITKKYKIPIIADSAESLGAKYKNKQVGNQCLAHSFSLFANKNITTGEGGLIVTNNYKLYKKLKIIRNQGQTSRYNHILLGNNYRMTDIQATIGVVQLRKLNKIIKEKNKIANFYNKNLKNLKQIELPFVPNYVSQHAWYNYAIKVSPKIRNKLVKFLAKEGIETRKSFPPIHIQPLYKKKLKNQQKHLIESSNAYNCLIDLPVWYGMKYQDKIKISSSIKKFFKVN